MSRRWRIWDRTVAAAGLTGGLPTSALLAVIAVAAVGLTLRWSPATGERAAWQAVSVAAAATIGAAVLASSRGTTESGQDHRPMRWSRCFPCSRRWPEVCSRHVVGQSYPGCSRVSFPAGRQDSGSRWPVPGDGRCEPLQPWRSSPPPPRPWCSPSAIAPPSIAVPPTRPRSPCQWSPATTTGVALDRPADLAAVGAVSALGSRGHRPTPSYAAALRWP